MATPTNAPISICMIKLPLPGSMYAYASEIMNPPSRKTTRVEKRNDPWLYILNSIYQQNFMYINMWFNFSNKFYQFSEFFHSQQLGSHKMILNDPWLQNAFNNFEYNLLVSYMWENFLIIELKNRL